MPLFSPLHASDLEEGKRSTSWISRAASGSRAMETDTHIASAAANISRQGRDNKNKFFNEAKESSRGDTDPGTLNNDSVNLQFKNSSMLKTMRDADVLSEQV